MLFPPAIFCRFKIRNCFNQLESTAPVRIMGCAKTMDPMLNDLFYNLLLLYDRSDDKETPNSKGATNTCNIMQIKISDRSCYDLVTPV